MKRIIIRTTLVVAAILVAFLVYTQFNSQRLTFEPDEKGIVAAYPIADGKIEIAPDVVVRLNTGSSISCLTPEQCRKLEEKGINVRRQWFPTLAHDSRGDMFVAWDRYIVDLPASLDPEDSRTIDNIIFVAAPEGTESMIGTDFLECFVMEYKPRRGTVRFRSALPKGYVLLTRLHSPLLDHSLLGNGNRYYTTLEVNNTPNKYFIDSGIDALPLKLPLADTVSGNMKSETELYHSYHGDVTALRSDTVWMKMGNRVGSRGALFAQTKGEKYVLNPMDFFTDDVVFDFRAMGIYIKTNGSLAQRD